MNNAVERIRGFLLNLNVGVVLRPIKDDKVDENLYIYFNLSSLFAYGLFLYYAWLDITGDNIIRMLKVIDPFFIALFTAYTINLYRMIRLRKTSWILIHVVYYLVLFLGYTFLKSATIR